jgi:hypothetical protein
MKLTQHQVDIIQDKTGLTPVPSQAAAESGLAEHFGDETFYVNNEGVYVFQEAQQPDKDSNQPQTVTAVMIAAVEPSGEDNELMVRGIDPRGTTLVVELA